VHPTAVLIGNVRIGARVYVGPHASIRADEPGPDRTVAPIIVEPEANVQDGVVVHALGGTSVVIGSGASIAHGAVVHGPCRIGRGSFVGFNSVIYDAELGEKVVIMHGALVEGVSVPAGLCVPSMTAVRCEEDVRCLEEASESALAFADRVRCTNVQLVESMNSG
jgi:carbonic anhydrase/acetyltransferase-like protein (isoleucine patch superfamily)